MSGLDVSGQALTGSCDNTLKLWDLKTGAVLHTFEGHTRQVWAVSADFEKRRALSGSCDRTLKLWDLDTGELLRTFTGHTGNVLCVVADFERQRALSSSQDLTLWLWDLNTGEKIRSFEAPRAFWPISVDFQQQLVLSGGWHTCLKLLDLDRGKALLTLSGHTGTPLAVAADFKRQRALMGSKDCTLKLWDLKCGWLMHTFRGHDIERLRALSCDRNNTLKLWDLEAYRELLTFTCDVRVGAVSADFERQLALLGTSAGTLKLWDLNAGGKLRSYSGHKGCVSEVSVDFRPNMMLTIVMEGDGVCCYTMGGTPAGPRLDGDSMDDVTIEDWCQRIADSLGKSVHRLTFVANFVEVDVWLGLTVRRAVQGLLGTSEEGGSSGSVQDGLSTPADENDVAGQLHKRPRTQ